MLVTPVKCNPFTSQSLLIKFSLVARPYHNTGSTSVCESSLRSHQDANNFVVSANTPFISILSNRFQKDFNGFIRFFQMNRMCFRNRRF